MSPRSSSEAMGPKKPNQIPDSPPQGLPLWDPRKFLERPGVYNFFQRAVGADRPRRRFMAEHVAPLGSARVLEVGCGPGTNCAWLPKSIEYVGCDLSEAYIAYARHVYGDRYQFFSGSGWCPYVPPDRSHKPTGLSGKIAEPVRQQALYPSFRRR